MHLLGNKLKLGNISNSLSNLGNYFTFMCFLLPHLNSNL
jgi:hypothetical protein